MCNWNVSNPACRERLWEGEEKNKICAAKPSLLSTQIRAVKFVQQNMCLSRQARKYGPDQAEVGEESDNYCASALLFLKNVCPEIEVRSVVCIGGVPTYRSFM